MTIVYALILKFGFTSVDDAEAFGMPFMNEVSKDIETYIQNGLNLSIPNDIPPILNKLIQVSNFEWLDDIFPLNSNVTFRLYLINVFIESFPDTQRFINKLISTNGEWLNIIIPTIGITYLTFLSNKLTT